MAGPALVPAKPGPRRPHKLGAEVVEALRAARTAQPDLRAGELVALVRDQFGLAVHRRSVERALAHAGPQYEPAGVPEPRCTDGYERLRCQAVRPGTGRDRCGLAVLARQGVAIWLHSLAELPVSAREPPLCHAARRRRRSSCWRGAT